jgi:hypothetical protein
MRLVINIPRRPDRELWQQHMLIESIVSGRPTHFICATEQQAKRTFAAVTSLLNGRDPKVPSG